MNEAQTLPAQIGQEEIKTLEQASIIPKGTPQGQIQVFARVCQEKGISPFSKEVHLLSYNTREGVKYATVIGIGGLRRIAAETGEFAGCDDVIFDLAADGSFRTFADIKKAEGKDKWPISASCTVYRIVGGQRVPFTATVLFEEFAATYKDRKTGQTKMKGNWSTMPFHMLAKCAEAMALKKGFSDQTNGLHIPEEQGAWESIAEEVLSDEELHDLIDKIREQVEGCTTKTALSAAFHIYESEYNEHPEVREIFNQAKARLTK